MSSNQSIPSGPIGAPDFEPVKDKDMCYFCSYYIRHTALCTMYSGTTPPVGHCSTFTRSKVLAALPISREQVQQNPKQEYITRTGNRVILSPHVDERLEEFFASRITGWVISNGNVNSRQWLPTGTLYSTLLDEDDIVGLYTPPASDNKDSQGQETN